MIIGMIKEEKKEIPIKNKLSEKVEIIKNDKYKKTKKKS